MLKDEVKISNFLNVKLDPNFLKQQLSYGGMEIHCAEAADRIKLCYPGFVTILILQYIFLISHLQD